MCQSMQVIFVDADQIVRADMGELYDMDIKGRPLAYTPFCDNNKDMDGYRFWRQVLTDKGLFPFFILLAVMDCPISNISIVFTWLVFLDYDP